MAKKQRNQKLFRINVVASANQARPVSLKGIVFTHGTETQACDLVKKKLTEALQKDGLEGINIKITKVTRLSYDFWLGHDAAQ